MQTIRKKARETGGGGERDYDLIEKKESNCDVKRI